MCEPKVHLLSILKIESRQNRIRFWIVVQNMGDGKLSVWFWSVAGIGLTSEIANVSYFRLQLFIVLYE